MEITTGTYQGSDGFVMAYAVLSVQAPTHPNFAKIKFGFKRSAEAEYTLLTGQLYRGRGWRVRIDGLTPATVYNFIAYSENAHGLLSESGNPTLTETMPGGNQLPVGLITKAYVDDEIDTLEEHVNTQDAGLQGNIDNVGFPAATELTIASGVVTVEYAAKFRFHKIDTEGDAATDNLNTINGGAEGELILIQAENAARIVTLMDGTNLKMKDNFALESTEDKILFICISTGVWHEITRSKVEGFSSPTELTIASDQITVSGNCKFRFHSVDTESDAATDDLETVLGGYAGEILILQAENNARDVVCKDGGNLKLTGDFTMNHTEDKIQLVCISSGVWHEITRSKVEGFSSPTELTIASDQITVSGNCKSRFHSVDTESDAATDDLETVLGGYAGDILILQAENNARDVVCKDGGNLKLAGDFTMDHTEDKIQLVCISSGVWHELTRSGNGV